MLEVRIAFADFSAANEIWDSRLAYCRACGSLIGRNFFLKNSRVFAYEKFLFLFGWRYRIPVVVFLLHFTMLPVGQSPAATQQNLNAVTGYFVQIMFLKYLSQGSAKQGTFVFHDQVSIENTWLNLCMSTGTLFGLCFCFIEKIKELAITVRSLSYYHNGPHTLLGRGCQYG